MSLLIAFVIVQHILVGSSYAFPANIGYYSTWNLLNQRSLMFQPHNHQVWQRMSRLTWSPYNNLPENVYQPEMQYFSSDTNYRTRINQGYEYFQRRNLHQRQSALFTILKCLIKNETKEFCDMIMDNYQPLFESEQKYYSPITIKIIASVETQPNINKHPHQNLQHNHEEFTVDCAQTSAIANPTNNSIDQINVFNKEIKLNITEEVEDSLIDQLFISTTESFLSAVNTNYTSDDIDVHNTIKTSENVTESLEPVRNIDLLVLQDNDENTTKSINYNTTKSSENATESFKPVKNIDLLVLEDNDENTTESIDYHTTKFLENATESFEPVRSLDFLVLEENNKNTTESINYNSTKTSENTTESLDPVRNIDFLVLEDTNEKITESINYNTTKTIENVTKSLEFATTIDL